jgi:hypothetical protein
MKRKQRDKVIEVILLTISIVLVFVGCDDPRESTVMDNGPPGLLRQDIEMGTTAEEEEDAPDDGPYRHPLTGEGVSRGAMSPDSPLKSQDGRRFAIEESTFVDEDNIERTFSGVVEVESRSMTTEERQWFKGD